MRTFIKELIERPRTKRLSSMKGWAAGVPVGLSETASEAWTACADSDKEHGTVYFIESGGFVKIGFTEKESAKSRLAAFETSSPFEYRVLSMVNGGRRLEHTLHEIFSEQRHRGEWFFLEGALKEFLVAVSGAPVRIKHGRKNPQGLRKDPHQEFEQLNLLRALGA